MNRLKINFISESRRCEICHQSDCYNPKENYCSRCNSLTNEYLRTSHFKDPELTFQGRYFSFSQTQKLVFGILSIFITVFITLAVPNLLSNGCRRTGASAVEALRLFHSVEATYQDKVGNGNFGTAEELFCEDLIDVILAGASGVLEANCNQNYKETVATRIKSGYIFRLNTTKATQNKPASFSAVALYVGTEKGVRNFFIDETGIIRFSENASQIPDASSEPIGN